MDPLQVLTYGVYLVGAVTFILGLKFLSSPATARRGNQIAAAGMTLVVLWVFVTDFLLAHGGIGQVWILAVGIPIGAVVGALG
ncbi:MAG: NAD(P)(+) transhydrogenase (Re/Si-specific) subunit beta, partial [Chloroflexota bacterium]|nr:NAD(P)(+) transhydrogenase (Re/Si-specific) subunit beta [Chloroflexota bacterium]